MCTCQGAPASERDVHNRFARTRSTGTDILRTSLSIGRSVRIIAVGAEAGGVLAYPPPAQLPVSWCWARLCLELTVTQPQLHDCPRLDRPSVRVRSHTVFTALARQPVGGWAIVAAQTTSSCFPGGKNRRRGHEGQQHGNDASVREW